METVSASTRESAHVEKQGFCANFMETLSSPTFTAGKLYIDTTQMIQISVGTEQGLYSAWCSANDICLLFISLSDSVMAIRQGRDKMEGILSSLYRSVSQLPYFPFCAVGTSGFLKIL